MSRAETWASIAGAFVLLAIVYLVVGRSIDAAVEWWRNLPAGEPVDVGRLVDFPTPTSRPSLAESAGAAYFGAWGDMRITDDDRLVDVELPSGMSVTVTGVSGFADPCDVKLVTGAGVELDYLAIQRRRHDRDAQRRHLRLVDDEPDPRGAA